MFNIQEARLNLEKVNAGQYGLRIPDYFFGLIKRFERRLKEFTLHVDEIEKYLTESGTHSIYSPQVLPS